MQTQRDSKGHIYGEVRNVRITYIPAADRAPEKDWPGSDVIRINALKEAGGLHMGAEFPVPTPEHFASFVGTFCQIYAEGIQANSTL
jgi:hypothetical protein